MHYMLSEEPNKSLHEALTARTFFIVTLHRIALLFSNITQEMWYE